VAAREGAWPDSKTILFRAELTNPLKGQKNMAFPTAVNSQITDAVTQPAKTKKGKKVTPAKAARKTKKKARKKS